MIILTYSWTFDSKTLGLVSVFSSLKRKKGRKMKKKDGIKRGQDGGQDREGGGREGKDYQALRTQS